ncbi:MAG: NADH-quinone oxidoreductase subunit N, partial [Anaerolineae bacterium CG_4_9_14_0_8_um_filter_58_9]
MTQTDLYTILPNIILVVWACILLLVDLFIPKTRKGWTALLAAVGLALTLGITLSQTGQSLTAFNGMIVLDGFS